MPLQVRLQIAPDVTNLRSRRSFQAIEAAIVAGAGRFEVAIVAFAADGESVHLLVEAASRAALARAIQGLSIRLAKRLNRLTERKGRVLADRYDARVLSTPAEVAQVVTEMRKRAGSWAGAPEVALPWPPAARGLGASVRPRSAHSRASLRNRAGATRLDRRAGSLYGPRVPGSSWIVRSPCCPPRSSHPLCRWFRGPFRRLGSSLVRSVPGAQHATRAPEWETASGTCPWAPTSRSRRS